jgi:glycosyltransferase involved in cell wall biosynthesis
MFRGGAAGDVSVALVAPYRNEEHNLPGFIAAVPDWVDEVIFVDGSSADRSSAVIQELMPDARQLIQPGIGKGVALAYGMLQSLSDIVIAVDTDGSMDPGHSDALVLALLNGADLAKGSRYLPTGGSDDLTALRSAGNRLLTVSANVLFGQKWSELCYGFFGLWTKHLQTLDVDHIVNARHHETFVPPYGSGFEIETLMFCRAAMRRLHVVEVPSYETRRNHGASNLRTFRDGVRVAWSLAVEKTKSRDE